MKNNNQINVPLISRGYGPFQDAYQASEVGVNLQSDYNGHLTSREADRVGNQTVKKVCPERTAKYQRQNRTAMEHAQVVEYLFRIVM